MTANDFTPVCVTLTRDHTVVVRAERPDQLILLEKNFYFAPELIDPERFIVTDRLYTCYYKGTCNWVDLKVDGRYLPDVAWVYPETLPDYEHIAGWYGFYPQTVHYTTGACTS